MPRGEMEVTLSPVFDEWIDGWERFGEEYSDEVQDALHDALQQMYGFSQQFVHVITGELKASGHVVMRRPMGTEVEGSVIYDADYAIFEHQRGGEHAYLDRAYVAAGPAFDGILMAAWNGTVDRWR